MKSFSEFLTEAKETVIKKVTNKANGKSVMITRLHLADGEKYHVYVSKSNHERGSQNKRMVLAKKGELDAEEAVALFNKEKSKAWK